jgi:hypothetical protein
MEENRNLDDPHGAGTCIASIACSRIGIMTKGTLVSMKALGDNGDITITGVIYALLSTLTHIDEEKRWGRSVVNIAISKSIVYRMTFVHANLFYRYTSRQRSQMGFVTDNVPVIFESS